MTDTNTEQIWLGTMTPELLVERVLGLRQDLPYAILERLDDIAFPASDEPIAVGDWERGRIFGETGELCWQRQTSGLFKTWFTGTGHEAVSELSLLPDLAATRQEDLSVFLWPPQSAALGREMDYRCLPPGKGNPVLHVRLFKTMDGSLAMTRYVSMAWEGA